MEGNYRKNLLSQAKGRQKPVSSPENGGRPSLAGSELTNKITTKMAETQDTPKKSGWGGRRAGAGRPNVRQATRSIGIRVPEDVAAILDRQENRTTFIIEAIRFYDKARREAGEAPGN